MEKRKVYLMSRFLAKVFFLNDSRSNFASCSRRLHHEPSKARKGNGQEFACRWGALTLLCGSVLAGCSSGNDESTSPSDVKEGDEFLQDASFDGVWRQRGYARLLHVEEDSVAVFDVTEVSCVPSDEWERAELNDNFERIRGNEETFSWYERGAFTRYEFDKLMELPATCADQDSDPLSSFDALVALFSENYAFFEERGIDWEETIKAGNDLDESSSHEDLMAVVQEMLTPFGDGHVYVFDIDNGQGFLGGSLGDLWQSWASEFEGNPVGENPIDPRGKFTAQTREYVLSKVLQGEGKSDLFDMLHWGFLTEEIGYLDVHAMGTYEAEIGIVEADKLVHEAMEKVMDDLRGADAIIVDARFNEGGYDTIGYAIASWFNSEARVVSQKQAVFDGGWTELLDIELAAQNDAYEGPVYLLTSRNTVSAAETFALALRELPQVTLVGTRTYGSLSDSLPRLLPNGWLVSLSNEVYQSPRGEVFEAEGVPPDEEVAYDDELSFEENLDRVLAEALELAAGDLE